MPASQIKNSSGFSCPAEDLPSHFYSLLPIGNLNLTPFSKGFSIFPMHRFLPLSIDVVLEQKNAQVTLKKTHNGKNTPKIFKPKNRHLKPCCESYSNLLYNYGLFMYDDTFPFLLYHRCNAVWMSFLLRHNSHLICFLPAWWNNNCYQWLIEDNSQVVNHLSHKLLTRHLEEAH